MTNPSPVALPPGSTTLDESQRRLQIEMNGIEVISESERTARPRDLFWPWFAANISVFGITYAAWILYNGVSFWQGLVVAILGITISFLLCGLVAIAGKRGNAPTMVLSRASFGVDGQKVPGVISWIVSVGWETFLAILAVLATSTVFERLGWASGTITQAIASAVVATLIVVASVMGYHTIMKMQSVLTWLTGAMTIAYIVMTFHLIDLGAVMAMPSGNMTGVLGSLVMVMTGFGLGWINIAADWSRYQHRDSSGTAIAFWNTFGGAIAPVVLVLYGLLLIGSKPSMIDAIGNDPIGTLAGELPTWFLLPFLVAVILTLVSGAVLGIYSSGLTLLSLGVRLPRPAAAAIDGVILTVMTIWVVFFAQSFIGPFQSFLITLGVPLAAWAGIFISDLALRKRPYDEPALFDRTGRYGAWDWVSIGTIAAASIIGWGLVVNLYAEDAPWNNWQGYLLEPLGLGDWSGSNIGVLLSLVIGFVVTYLARAAKVRRQEERS